MRLLFVSIFDSLDKGSWSGVPAHMREALAQTEVTLEVAGPLQGFDANAATRLMGLWPRLKVWACRRMGAGTYEVMRDPLLCRLWAREVERAVRRTRPDVVLSVSSLPVAKLRTTTPIVLWADATFDGMLGTYYPRAHFARSAVRNGHSREQEALRLASAVVYPSAWAAETARMFYEVDAARLHVVPYGCNLSDPPSGSEVETAIARRTACLPECRLLFVGQDWVRKGGSHAVAVATQLCREGRRCTLTIVGQAPPSGQIPTFLRYEGFLRKGVAEENLRLRQLLSESHFLIGPSLADCGGMVFAEGGAFGVPSVATNVGGIPTVIKDGINGQTFALSAGPADWVRYISQMLDNPAEYRAMCRSSRREYETRLNWQTSCDSVIRLCRQLIA